jgi:hypothetical protein
MYFSKTPGSYGQKWTTTPNLQPEGVFLDVIGTKILLDATTESGWGLALFTLSLSLPWKVALLFLLLYFIYV